MGEVRSEDAADLGYDPPLDPGIRGFVVILAAGGVETFESCEGGDGHSFPEPTVRFHGGVGAGLRALAVAFDHGLPVRALRKTWDVEDGDPTGPCWEMVFYAKAPAVQAKRCAYTGSL